MATTSVIREITVMDGLSEFRSSLGVEDIYWCLAALSGTVNGTSEWQEVKIGRSATGLADYLASFIKLRGK